MTHDHRRQQTLERALAAFDQAHARRRGLRRAGGTTAVLALVAAAAYMAWPGERSPIGATPVLTKVAAPLQASNPRAYPSYVEVLNDDQDLQDALEAFGACEGFGREGDRVFIVECGAELHSPPA